MHDDPVRLAPDLLATLVDDARAAAPREACGLLIGRGRWVVRCHAAGNLATATSRYEIAPEDHFAALRLARRQGLEVIGAYHSHPSSAPVPSATDVAEAHAGFLYLIVGLVPAPEVRAWWLVDGNFAALGFVRTE